MVVLGDSGVGKTNMIKNYTKSIQDILPHKPTVGVEYFSKLIPNRDGKVIKAQIWDTAGQERFRSVATEYHPVN